MLKKVVTALCGVFSSLAVGEDLASSSNEKRLALIGADNSFQLEWGTTLGDEYSLIYADELIELTSSKSSQTVEYHAQGSLAGEAVEGAPVFYRTYRNGSLKVCLKGTANAAFEGVHYVDELEFEQWLKPIGAIVREK
ncbi:hypothetical protein [Vibrio crassostreae]|uniref:hypothetical protein n=1 Tax=Vibrio crassostreae TaxID=246167 RepID=UPI001B30DB98|nr:hypothetical protein [Vibrio crassostreae]